MSHEIFPSFVPKNSRNFANFSTFFSTSNFFGFYVYYSKIFATDMKLMQIDKNVLTELLHRTAPASAH